MYKLSLFSIAVILISLCMKKNALTVLLCLEMLCLFLITLSLYLGVDMFFGLMLLCVGACEGAVGLSALISMSRLKSMTL